MDFNCGLWKVTQNDVCVKVTITMKTNKKGMKREEDKQ